MKKEITKKGYRTLAVVWTLAAAAMAAAFVRYLPVKFNLFLLVMAILSTLTAASFWKAYKQTPERAHPAAKADPFDAPPKFNGTSALFDDDPPPAINQNQDSEEKNHER